MRRIWFIIVLLAVCLVGCSGGGKPTAGHKLTIEVVNRALGSKPVAGAFVQVGANASGDETTGANGIVSFLGLTGEVEVSVSAPHFKTQSLKFTVSQDLKKRIELEYEEEVSVVAAEKELEAALENEQVAVVVLKEKIELAKPLKVTKPKSLEVHASIGGDLKYEFEDVANVELSGDGELQGNFVVNAPNGTITNSVKVDGLITIDAVAPRTWNEKYDKNTLWVNCSDIVVNLLKGAEKITIAQNTSGNEINIEGPVQMLEAFGAVTITGAKNIVHAQIKSPEVYVDSLDFDYEKSPFEPILKADNPEKSDLIKLANSVLDRLEGIFGGDQREAYHEIFADEILIDGEWVDKEEFIEEQLEFFETVSSFQYVVKNREYIFDHEDAGFVVRAQTEQWVDGEYEEGETQFLFVLQAGVLKISGVVPFGNDPDEPFKVAVITGSSEQGYEEYYMAQQLASRYPELVEHATFPDNFMQENEAYQNQLLTLGSDPSIKAIVAMQAIPGTAEAFSQLKKMRADLVLVAALPHEDHHFIAEVADLVIETDNIARGTAIARLAAEMGATKILHYSFPRHMNTAVLQARFEVMECEAQRLGLEMIQVETPDPMSGGIPALQGFVAADIPKQVTEHGQDIAFFGTNCAMMEPAIRACLETGMIFLEQCCPSFYHGYPEALGIEIPAAVAGDLAYIEEAIRQGVAENGRTGRFATWAMPANMLLMELGVEFALRYGGQGGLNVQDALEELAWELYDFNVEFNPPSGRDNVWSIVADSVIF